MGKVQQHRLIRAVVGSRAHGTADELSDTDIHVVFAVPTEDFFRVDQSGRARPKDVLWEERKTKNLRDPDVTGWELAKFIQLAIQCNPTVLEVLWAPDIKTSNLGQRVLESRQAFLSRQKVYDAFVGFAKNRRTKMFEQPEVAWGPRNWKFAEAYIRTLFQGLKLLDDGEMPVNLREESPEMCTYLVEVKRGRTKAGGVIDTARRLEQELHSALQRSNLQDQPNLNLVNKVVVSIRNELLSTT